MNYREFQNEIDRGIFGSVYLFSAGDAYIADSYVDYLKQKLSLNTDDFLNLNIFNEKSNPVEEIFASLNMLPIGAEKKLVVIKRDDIFKESALCAGLNEYLKRPNEDCVLVIYTQNTDKRTALYKKIAASYKEVVFARLSGSELSEWVEKSFQKRGYTADRAVVSYITDAVGGKDSAYDCGYIVRQIDKLSSAGLTGKRITLNQLSQYTSFPLEADVFAYVDAVITQDTAKAYALLSRMGKTAPHQVIAAAASSIRRMTLCAYLSQNGYSEGEIAKSHALHPYAVKMALKTAAKCPIGNALSALNELSYADRYIKRGELDAADALYVITADITSRTYSLTARDKLFSAAGETNI